MKLNAVGRVEKRGGTSSVTVVVEASQAETFKMSCSFRTPALVRTSSGDLLPEESVKAACLSGAAYARRHLRLERLSIEIVQVEGACEESESDGLAVATIAAIAAVTKSQKRIASEAFDDWELVENQF